MKGNDLCTRQTNELSDTEHKQSYGLLRSFDGVMYYYVDLFFDFLLFNILSMRVLMKRLAGLPSNLGNA